MKKTQRGPKSRPAATRTATRTDPTTRAFFLGAQAAADHADQYNSVTRHEYRLGDYILGKMNLRDARPRKNPFYTDAAKNLNAFTVHSPASRVSAAMWLKDRVEEMRPDRASICAEWGCDLTAVLNDLADSISRDLPKKS